MRMLTRRSSVKSVADSEDERPSQTKQRSSQNRISRRQYTKDASTFDTTSSILSAQNREAFSPILEQSFMASSTTRLESDETGSELTVTNEVIIPSSKIISSHIVTRIADSLNLLKTKNFLMYLISSFFNKCSKLSQSLFFEHFNFIPSILVFLILIQFWNLSSQFTNPTTDLNDTNDTTANNDHVSTFDRSLLESLSFNFHVVRDHVISIPFTLLASVNHFGNSVGENARDSAHKPLKNLEEWKVVNDDHVRKLEHLERVFESKLGSCMKSHTNDVDKLSNLIRVKDDQLKEMKKLVEQNLIDFRAYKEKLEREMNEILKQSQNQRQEMWKKETDLNDKLFALDNQITNVENSIQKLDKKVVFEVDNLSKSIEESQIHKQNDNMNFATSVTTNTFNMDLSLLDHKIEKAIQLFSEDKTGMFDFALESAGAEIVATPGCTTPYDQTRAAFTLFSITFWKSQNTPRSIIQANVSPSQCWAFVGSKGEVVVKLSWPIIVTHVTMEHISKQLTPTKSIASAPKLFEVYGISGSYHLEENNDFLGAFEYLDNSRTVQSFEVKEGVESNSSVRDRVHESVKLRVLSNHGHPDYTCIYRFRVHGHKI